MPEEPNKKPLFVWTNLRQFTDPIVGWDIYYGGALASVALALQGLLGQCLIASSSSDYELYQWGAHPSLDSLWSTEVLTFQHDARETARIEKCRHLADSDIALRNLRVCWSDPTSYNCGRCAKCIRTMLELQIAGARGRAWSFPTTLTPEAVRQISPCSDVYWFREVRASLSNSGEDELLDAVDYVLSKAPDPRIEELIPPTTFVGQGFQVQPLGESAITIRGSHFSPKAQIRFDGQALVTAYGDSETLSAIVPADYYCEVREIEVTVVSIDERQASNSIPFKVLPAAGRPQQLRNSP